MSKRLFLIKLDKTIHIRELNSKSSTLCTYSLTGHQFWSNHLDLEKVNCEKCVAAFIEKKLNEG